MGQQTATPTVGERLMDAWTHLQDDHADAWDARSFRIAGENPSRVLNVLDRLHGQYHFAQDQDNG